jgi:flagellar secretion chaperone FliS
MDAYAQYRQQAATTATPAQLVTMLYDGALSEVARATRALMADPVDLADAHECLGRAQAILSHLLLTLDHDRGGDVAANLASLYTFCNERLIEANLRKSADGLDAVTDTLAGLRDAWEAACVQAQPITVPGGVAVAG